MGNFLGFIDTLSKGVTAVAPVVQSINELSKNISGGSSSPSAGTYTPGAAAGDAFYKKPWFIPVAIGVAVVVLFWKKIKRLIR